VFVSSRASSLCLQFVDLGDSSSPIGEIVLGFGEVVFSGEPSTIGVQGILRFSLPCAAHPSLLPPLPRPHVRDAVPFFAMVREEDGGRKKMVFLQKNP
jgi:hypothetical protein